MSLTMLVPGLRCGSSRTTCRRPTSTPRRVRLAVEALEDRSVPSITAVLNAEVTVEITLSTSLVKLHENAHITNGGITDGSELQGLYKNFEGALRSAAGGHNNLITSLPNLLADSERTALKLLRDPLADVAAGLNNVANAVSAIGAHVSTLSGNALTVAATVAGNLLADVERDAGALSKKLMAEVASAGADATKVIAALSANVTNALQNVESGLTALSGTLMNLANQTISDANGLAGAVLTDVASTLQTVNASLTSIENSLIAEAGATQSEIQPFLDTVTGQLFTILGTIAGAIVTIEGQVFALVPTPDAVMQQVTALVTLAADEVTTLANDLSRVQTAVQDGTDAIVNSVESLIFLVIADAEAILAPQLTEV